MIGPRSKAARLGAAYRGLAVWTKMRYSPQRQPIVGSRDEGRVPVRRRGIAFVVGTLWAVTAGFCPARAQVDATAAEALAKRNDCFKCHAIDKAKKAPAYKKIAARLKSKPDAVEVVITHITTGPMVELNDGTEAEHRIVDTKDSGELRNLAQWILSL